MKCNHEAKLGLIADLIASSINDIKYETGVHAANGDTTKSVVLEAATLTLLAAIGAIETVLLTHRDAVHAGDHPQEQAEFTAGLVTTVRETINGYLKAARRPGPFVPPQNFN